MEVNDYSDAHGGPGEDRPLRVLDEVVTRMVASKRTGEAYSLFEVAVPPRAGRSPHIHHREDECLYVLEGEFEFLIEGRAVRERVGSLFYVPRGKLHAHKNVGNVVGRLLVITTPGGLQERLVEEVGEPVSDGTAKQVPEHLTSVEGIAKIAAGYGTEIPSLPRNGARERTRRVGADHLMCSSRFPDAGGSARISTLSDEQGVPEASGASIAPAPGLNYERQGSDDQVGRKHMTLGSACLRLPVDDCCWASHQRKDIDRHVRPAGHCEGIATPEQKLATALLEFLGEHLATADNCSET